MLVKLKLEAGSPLYVNPDYVTLLRQVEISRYAEGTSTVVLGKKMVTQIHIVAQPSSVMQNTERYHVQENIDDVAKMLNKANGLKVAAHKKEGV
jgi:hypothetical protein